MQIKQASISAARKLIIKCMQLDAHNAIINSRIFDLAEIIIIICWLCWVIVLLWACNWVGNTGQHSKEQIIVECINLTATMYKWKIFWKILCDLRGSFARARFTWTSMSRLSACTLLNWQLQALHDWALATERTVVDTIRKSVRRTPDLYILFQK